MYVCSVNEALMFTAGVVTVITGLYKHCHLLFGKDLDETEDWTAQAMIAD